MNIEYLNRIKFENNWLFDKEKEYYLVCTDDLDSLMSCLLILMYRPNMKIGAYFDYRDGMYENIFNDDVMTQENTIYVDCSSIKKGDKCISNHLTSINGKIHNVNDINLNSLDNNYRDKNYFHKYNLSTFLLLVSIFSHEGYEINNKVGQVLSLCFDSSYKAYYQPSKYADSRVQKRYLQDILELHDIYDVQLDMTKKEFTNIQLDQNLNSKVYADTEGIRTFEQVDLEMLCKYLNITTDLKCLDGIYAMTKASKSTTKHISKMRDLDLQNTYITSFAITSRNNVSFSFELQGN